MILAIRGGVCRPSSKRVLWSLHSKWRPQGERLRRADDSQKAKVINYEQIKQYWLMRANTKKVSSGDRDIEKRKGRKRAETLQKRKGETRRRECFLERLREKWRRAG